jgi:hypothetical protein
MTPASAWWTSATLPTELLLLANAKAREELQMPGSSDTPAAAAAGFYWSLLLVETSDVQPWQLASMQVSHVV